MKRTTIYIDESLVFNVKAKGGNVSEICRKALGGWLAKAPDSRDFLTEAWDWYLKRKGIEDRYQISGLMGAFHLTGDRAQEVLDYLKARERRLGGDSELTGYVNGEAVQ